MKCDRKYFILNEINNKSSLSISSSFETLTTKNFKIQANDYHFTLQHEFIIIASKN